MNAVEKNIIKYLNNIYNDNSIQITLSIPPDLNHGDFTVNIAFQLSKQLKKAPLQIAKEIVNQARGKIPGINKIEARPPGYINFWYSQEFIINTVNRLIREESPIAKTMGIQNKKIMVEFTDPNPFKEFHIGHLYSNIVGESISRLLEAQGADVKRVCYQGDVGLHVAKAIWGIQKKLLESKMTLKDFDHHTLDDKTQFLGQAYAYGASAYEENEEAKNEIIAINKKIYTHEDEEICLIYRKGKEWSLLYFDKIYHRLGTKFWKFYFESDAGKIGVDFVKNHIKDGTFIEDNGAIIFKGERFGLHTRVFINSQGLPTYEAKELGLAPTKYTDFPYDESIIITANEINEYFRVLLKSLSLINPELAEKTKHISHGIVRLPSGKMSSRSGKIITGEWLLDEANKKAKEKIQEAKFSGTTEKVNDLNNIADKVGIGAVKYALLKSSIGKDIEFDFDKSITFEGNAGPYLQYTYVRTQSILAKGGDRTAIEEAYIINDAELQLVRIILQFQNVIKEATVNLAPNTLCSYLYELAKHYNLFYQTQRIVDAESHSRINFRLNITKIVGKILYSGLDLLGIAAPQRM